MRRLGKVKKKYIKENNEKAMLIEEWIREKEVNKMRDLEKNRNKNVMKEDIINNSEFEEAIRNNMKVQ